VNPWIYSDRADPHVRVIADRHYNRQKIGAKQFVPPGRCVVLEIPAVAFWVTSWPFPEYVKHAWPGAWVCSAFRNERRDLWLSSVLVTYAVAATLAAPHTDVARWSEPPDIGMITFVDEDKTRRKRDPGRCFRRAGFVEATPPTTAGGLIALQLAATSMPPPMPAQHRQGSLWFAT
jgi:hypothetical protein